MATLRALLDELVLLRQKVAVCEAALDWLEQHVQSDTAGAQRAIIEGEGDQSTSVQAEAVEALIDELEAVRERYGKELEAVESSEAPSKAAAPQRRGRDHPPTDGARKRRAGALHDRERTG